MPKKILTPDEKFEKNIKKIVNMDDDQLWSFFMSLPEEERDIYDNYLRDQRRERQQSLLFSVKDECRTLSFLEAKKISDIGNDFLKIIEPAKFLTSTRNWQDRVSLFEKFKILLIDKKETSAAEILVTGKSNPAFEVKIDGDVYNPGSKLSDRIGEIMFIESDGMISWLQSNRISPKIRMDQENDLGFLDKSYDYFSLDEIADDIRVGYKPPKPSDDDNDRIIYMLSPENINEIGEIIGKPQAIRTKKTINILPLRVGDLIIVWFGGNRNEGDLGRVGYGAIVDDRFAKGNCYINHGMFKVTLRKDIDPYYILFALGEQIGRAHV